MKAIQSILIFGGMVILTSVVLSGTARACGGDKEWKESQGEKTETTVQNESATPVQATVALKAAQAASSSSGESQTQVKPVVYGPWPE